MSANVIHVVLYDNPTKSQMYQIVDQKTDPKGVDSLHALTCLKVELLNCLKRHHDLPESELRPKTSGLIHQIFDMARKSREKDDAYQERMQLYLLDTGSFLCITWLDQSDLAHDRAKQLTYDVAVKIWERRLKS
jgi:hypothetical protein